MPYRIMSCKSSASRSLAGPRSTNAANERPVLSPATSVRSSSCARDRQQQTHDGKRSIGRTQVSPQQSRELGIGGDNQITGVLEAHAGRCRRRRLPNVQGELEDFLVPHIRAGRVQPTETVVDGFDNIVNAFLGMLRGENVGKMLVRA
ncbi:hypothetical protein [Micromonospora sp. CB01531]|uniref:hypothetical protein n=1 Tax=Micromonospora sp. CB01531 TaxID=1718947 RepID=UPI0018EA053E